MIRAVQPPHDAQIGVQRLIEITRDERADLLRLIVFIFKQRTKTCFAPSRAGSSSTFGSWPPSSRRRPKYKEEESVAKEEDGHLPAALNSNLPPEKLDNPGTTIGNGNDPVPAGVRVPSGALAINSSSLKTREI